MLPNPEGIIARASNVSLDEASSTTYRPRLKPVGSRVKLSTFYRDEGSRSVASGKASAMVPVTSGYASSMPRWYEMVKPLHEKPGRICSVYSTNVRALSRSSTEPACAAWLIAERASVLLLSLRRMLLSLVTRASTTRR